MTTISRSLRSPLALVPGLVLAMVSLGAMDASAGVKAYIAQQNNVKIIDTQTQAVIKTIAVGSGPFAVGASPGVPYVVVGNITTDNASVISTITDTVVATIPVGDNPYGAAVHPDGSRAYVSNYWSNNVSVIDFATMSVIATIPVGRAPGGLAFSPDGSRLYGTAGGDNTVFAIDTATGQVVDSLVVGSSPWGLAVSPDGARVYTAHYNGSTMAVINAADLTLITTVTTGLASVDVAVNADGSRAYVVNRDSDSVSVINTVDFSVINIPVGDRPHGIDLHPNGTELYVTNTTTGSVSVIGAASNVVTATITGIPLAGSYGTFIASSPATAPAAPSITSAAPGNGVATLQVQAPADDGGAPITGYQATCTPGPINASSMNTTIELTGLANGTTYTCTVIATNSVGASAASTSIDVVPRTIPGAPRNVVMSAQDQGAQFQFDEPLSDGGSAVIDYTVTCNPGALTIVVTDTSATLGSLVNNSVYRCSVRARNVAGDGPASPDASVIPGLAATNVDLSIAKTNSTDFVNDGDAIPYVIVVTNPGPGAVVGARVEDAIAPDFANALWSCGSTTGAFCAQSGNGSFDQLIDLPANASATIIWSGYPAMGPDTPITNIASVTPPASVTDPNLANNVASDGPDIRGIFRNGFE